MRYKISTAKTWLSSAGLALLLTAVPTWAITITEDDFEGSFDDFDVYEFNVSLGGGARFEGSFVAADFDGDGIISSNASVFEQRLDSNGSQIDIRNEVALLRGQYVGPNNDLAALGSQDYRFDPGSFFDTFFPQNILAFHLDGEGRIGGPTILGHPELLNIIIDTEGDGPGQERLYAIAAGEVQASIAFPPSQSTGQADFVSAIFPCQPGQECAILYEGFEVAIEDPENPLNEEPVFIFDFQAESFSTGIGNGLNVTNGPLGEALGADEVAALMPDAVNDDGSFQFNVDFDTLGVSPNQLFFIDPDIAIGYTYEVTGASFTAVQAPSLGVVNDPDGYTLSYGSTVVSLAPGEIHTFAGPITEFIITGISQDLMLDPIDTMAFVTGIAVDTNVGQISISQTPLTVFVDPTNPNPSAVPLPASLLMLLAGLGGLFGLRRKI